MRIAASLNSTARDITANLAVISMQSSQPQADQLQTGGDRLPLIPEATLSEAQRAAVAALVASPRGQLRGPFIPMLRSPEFMDQAQRLGEYLRYRSSIPLKLREFAILIAARHWHQTYEWNAHASLAEKAGVPSEIITALGREGGLTDLPHDEAVIYDFCTELQLQHAVSDATYAHALELLGEQGVIDLCGVQGYYSMLAMILNVARTPVPGNPSLPFSLPGA